MGSEDDPEMTPIWDLDGGVVLMDYSLASGYGEVDITFLVPSSLFDTTGKDCSYGSESCTTYLVMWNEFGNYTDSALYPKYNWGNNGGFEEWGVIIRAIVNISKDALVTVDRVVDWHISLTTDPDTHDLAECQSGTSWYDLKVTKSEVIDIAASGTITIQNPTGGDGYPIPAEIDAVITDVQDVIAQGDVETGALVDCGVTFAYTLCAGDSLVCSYTASLATADAGSNTATATFEVLDDAGTPEPETSTVSGMVELVIPPRDSDGLRRDQSGEFGGCELGTNC